MTARAQSAVNYSCPECRDIVVAVVAPRGAPEPDDALGATTAAHTGAAPTPRLPELPQHLAAGTAVYQRQLIARPGGGDEQQRLRLL